MTHELADSIKRLRELDAKRTKGKWLYSYHGHGKVTAPAVKGCGHEDIFLGSPSCRQANYEIGAAIPDMMQTINQLVDMVAEMRDCIKDDYMYDGVSAKANALLSALKEGV